MQHKNTGGAFRCIVAWCRGHIPDVPLVFVLAFATGLVSGGCASLLKWMIGSLGRLLTSGPDYVMLALPLAGIVITGLVTRYVMRMDIAHGVRQLIGDLRRRDYSLRPELLYSPMAASAITLGFGGSAGSEGPIAYTGAAVGSNLGRLFGLQPGMMKVLVGCGAAAGIAGIFKAPVGGMLFTLEVLQIGMTTMSVLALLVSCLTSALTSYVIEGYTIDLDFMQLSPPPAGSGWWWIVGLGVFCGLYSAYYSYVMKTVDRWLSGIGRPLVRNVVAGGLLSVAVFLFPALYGEGYQVVQRLINGCQDAVPDRTFLYGMGGPWPIVAAGAGILLIKCMAASATNNGGCVAGDFAPTLFAGAVAGLTFSALANAVAGAGLPVGNFALFGMAGVMAGTIHAPLMAIFLTVEMTASYPYLLPVSIVAAISFGVIRLFNFHSFYSTKI